MKFLVQYLNKRGNSGQLLGDVGKISIQGQLPLFFVKSKYTDFLFTTSKKWENIWMIMVSIAMFQINSDTKEICPHV